ncbi:phosphoenolpyruvate carboxylase [Methermicoccus shengliensis]|uniref:Phosphoenolpyruvate carboxylase n=1 Tax=Methermicoccus shengliensis TaxID=660064 RepID=A0A832RWI5_9EURY|nr:phosphoenolpyruvate carboxylase [Methermicoccus shengliensis]KUK04837.1 MAG: Phosphoenolpyruvate carboxylase [Euryarchaeota archaeon 55_53]KUK30465.1 MAG: Phosphoenolpyruvate carboxylase [Methanosarcinales archeaon 56_1174]MDI3487877.1 phosphoenolpyruvate carboxylase [Methanosarcinales archaeon]MDN5295381.1 phosphoenolpyruvate carboxylase [Methanosarcinales archaeon]HIH69533.1 phosphoenolpyruvate carboxylase [Methermicoccus shengliensis]
MKIPKCMSTQHPDNVHLPFFAESTELGGEDEIQEAYYVFSHLGCDEQMWDCEGKEVDNFVVKKLLTKYESFFRETRLGRDVFITLRVPNPTVEKAEAKILLETLESIPRSFDAAKLFYGDDTPPIFEVILPMTASPMCLDRIYRYYCDFVVGKQNKLFREGDITIAEWIGEFKPEIINVIPLFEDMEHMLDAHNMTREYLKDKDVEHQRVFLARSDPAMNYGHVSAVLLNKIALQRLQTLSEDIGVEIYPIVGVGSAPFRGNLRPQTVERVAKEYPSTHTLTVQSAFKYDNPPDEVKRAIRKLQERKTRSPHEIYEERCLEIIGKYSQEYQKQIIELAPVINRVARYVPSRRRRKLHIGLFGYSRSIGKISLPRAITFTAALYSLGLPPEILGLNALDEEDIQFIREVYVNFDYDLGEALRYFNQDTPFLPKGLETIVSDFPVDFQPDEEHKELTDHIIGSLKENKTEDLGEYVLRAANLRRFLG